MKKISQNQIEAIMAELLKLNVPVQTYSGIQKLFEGLEVIAEPKPETPA